MVAPASAPTKEPPGGDGGAVRVGLGSYRTTLPDKAREPQPEIYKTHDWSGPVPTNDWWSSLLWVPLSDCMYPHPLAIKAEKSGLRVYHPSRITADAKTIHAGMPGDKQDFILGHSQQAEFTDARVAAFSDWFVTVAFGERRAGMRVTFGHGSPFVFAVYQGGEAVVTFDRQPEVWSGANGSAVVGLSVDGRHYGLFGPGGSTWSRIGDRRFTCAMQGKNYVSAAILPDNRPATLALFQKHAYAHVVDTRVAWSYEPSSSTVTAEFRFTTRPMEGTQRATLFALYPHQWRYSDAPLLGPSYPCLRGTMKLASGTGFRTQVKFPGVLPALPGRGTCDKARLRSLVEEAAVETAPGLKDTYWEGKDLGRLACLSPIAQQAGADEAEQTLRRRLRERLQQWFTATESDGRLKSRGVFYCNRPWGTLIGYPASYGSDWELSDHHFHYGYYIMAAAEIARKDPPWAARDRWGGMVDLLVRDIACPDRDDSQFPFLRNFDPYEGHSWASGRAVFADGNNQESSSEAMNAWTGLILWGQFSGDEKIRDLGIYLYTTEMTAIQEYWFDIRGENHPADFKPIVATLIWGGKMDHLTWFSPKPEAIHDINWMPFHGGSLYLGHDPRYVRREYDALLKEKGDDNWSERADHIWMYLALADADAAMQKYAAHADGNFAMENGNSKANLYHWLGNLQFLGHVDASITADYPLYRVFNRNGRRTYVVYNSGPGPRTVTFSDNTQIKCPAPGFFGGKSP